MIRASSQWLLFVIVGVAFPLFKMARAVAQDAAPPVLIASPEPDWPLFRGPRRDGVCDEQGLLQSWLESGPNGLWSVSNLGRGYSAPIIARGRLFITGDKDEELRLFAFDLQGRPLWQAKNGASWKDPYPGSRASVAYAGGRIFHGNAHGRIACFDAENGHELWAVNVLEKFGGQNITWGLSECLLADERAVYVTAGGSEALIVALDQKTGAVLWKSDPLRDSEGERRIEAASYVSPILVRFANQRLLIGCSLNHLFCADADTGKLQWTRRFPTTYSVLSMMPAVVGDGVFMTAPHGKGGRFLRLIAPAALGGAVSFEESWTTRLDTLQGSVVHFEGKLLGAFYPGRKGWAAVDARSGEVLYDAPQFVKGAGVLADGRLYALCEDGMMLLLQPTETEFAVKGRFRFADAKERDAWAHPVVHQGRLYLRYHDTLTCYDVGSPKR